MQFHMAWGFLFLCARALCLGIASIEEALKCRVFSMSCQFSELNLVSYDDVS